MLGQMASAGVGARELEQGFIDQGGAFLGRHLFDFCFQNCGDSLNGHFQVQHFSPLWLSRLCDGRVWVSARGGSAFGGKEPGTNNY